jgi:hypothetical protein
VLPVAVLDDVCDFVVRALEEDVFVKAEVFVNTDVPLIVTEGNPVGVGLKVDLDENVDVVVFVEVLDIVPVELGTIPFIKRVLSIL